MFRKIENPFNKPNTNKDCYYLAAANQLLESLCDKDDQVKAVAEASLIKIADKKPDEVIIFVCDYKKKSGKLADATSAVLLR